MSGRDQRQGVTLVELVVAIAILGLLASTAALAVGSGQAARSPAEDARTRALQSGEVVYLQDSTSVTVYHPDGRATGPGLDPLTGASFESGDTADDGRNP